MAQNNYGFGLTTPGSTLVSINAINTAMGLLTQGGVRAHLVSTYLKAFDPANIAAVKASGGACPTVSTAQGFTDILIMIIIVAVLTALGVVLGVVVRIPGSLESGFSNFASYSELGKLSERLNDLDAKLDAMAGAKLFFPFFSLSNFHFVRLSLYHMHTISHLIYLFFLFIFIFSVSFSNQIKLFFNSSQQKMVKKRGRNERKVSERNGNVKRKYCYEICCKIL